MHRIPALRPSIDRTRPKPLRESTKKPVRCPMSKLLAVMATSKAALVAASFACARGDMLSVILISILLNLIDVGARPSGEAMPRDSVVGSRSHDQ
jgi:hypothetical protein